MSKPHTLLIYIVAYNAQDHIEKVFKRIPVDVLKAANIDYTILVSDDASKDKTSEIVKTYQAAHKDLPIELVTQTSNLQYGGNQKFGYQYSLKHNFDSVVMLHGDDQYPAEYIPQMIEPIVKDQHDVMLGSRMISKPQALKGDMPLYKFIGNIILTSFQNILLGSKLSEFHTGFRAYHRRVLEHIPFEYNDNGFSFDTDILIQTIDNGFDIGEISIPTYYGEEVCHVNGIYYATRIAWTTFISRFQRLSFIRCPKFTYKPKKN